MPLPLFPLLVLGAGVALLLASDKKSGGAPTPFPGGGGSLPGGALPPGANPLPAGQGGGFLLERDGVQYLRPDLQPWVMQALALKGTAPNRATPPESIVDLVNGSGANAWVAQQNAAGLIVLMTANMPATASGQLAAVRDGRERELATVGGLWAVLAEPGGQAAPGPIPGGGLPGGGPTVPGSYVPGGSPAPGGGEYPPGDIPLPGGLGSIPGGIFPGGAAPPIPGGFPIPGGAAPPAPGGAAPAGRVHVIQNGDTAGSMAVWYTGNFGRTRELESTNPQLRLTTRNGAVGYEPWQQGQQVVLPAGWDAAARGGQSMPAGWFPGGSGGGGGGSVPTPPAGGDPGLPQWPGGELPSFPGNFPETI